MTATCGEVGARIRFISTLWMPSHVPQAMAWRCTMQTSLRGLMALVMSFPNQLVL
jgi:hypothetical protein